MDIAASTDKSDRLGQADIAKEIALLFGLPGQALHGTRASIKPYTVTCGKHTLSYAAYKAAVQKTQGALSLATLDFSVAEYELSVLCEHYDLGAQHTPRAVA